MLLPERKDLHSIACCHWILCKLCNSFHSLNIWKVLISDHVKKNDLNLNFPHHISLIKFTFQSLKMSFVQIKWGEVILVYADKKCKLLSTASFPAGLTGGSPFDL